MFLFLITAIAMATLTGSFTKGTGALFLETTATGVAPSIEFTYPIAHVTGGTISIEYCHAVSSTSESEPPGATVTSFYQSIPVTSSLDVNDDDGVTVITGKIPSVRFAPVSVVCRLTLSPSAQVEPTTQEYITERGSLLLDDSVDNTAIQPALVSFPATHHRVVVGFQGEDQGFRFKMDNFPANGAHTVGVNFGKYVIFPSHSEELRFPYTLLYRCHITEGDNATLPANLLVTGSVRNGGILGIGLTGSTKAGDSLVVDCPDFKPYHAKEMVGKYGLTIGFNGGLPNIPYGGAYSFIADDESTTDDNTSEDVTETNEESTETNEPTTSDATETSDESNETNDPTTSDTTETSDESSETNETNEPATDDVTEVNDGSSETSEDASDTASGEATSESTDDASEISTSGTTSTGFALVGAVAIAFVLSILG